MPRAVRLQRALDDSTTALADAATGIADAATADATATTALADAATALGGAVKAKRLVINFDDAALDVAGLTAEIAMGSLPAGAIVVGFDVDVDIDFAGTTTLDVDLGDAGGDEFADGVDLKTLARTSSLVAIANSDGNGIAVTALVTASVENLDQLSAGNVTVSVLFLESEDVPVG